MRAVSRSRGIPSSSPSSASSGLSQGRSSLSLIPQQSASFGWWRGYASRSRAASAPMAGGEDFRQNAGRGNEMDVSDLQRADLLQQESPGRAPSDAMPEAEQEEDGMGRESIRSKVNFSFAMDIIGRGDEVKYEHPLDEDQERREELLARLNHHDHEHHHLHHHEHHHQDHHDEHDDQQLLGSDFLAGESDLRRRHPSEKNFYKWG